MKSILVLVLLAAGIFIVTNRDVFLRSTFESVTTGVLFKYSASYTPHEATDSEYIDIRKGDIGNKEARGFIIQRLTSSDSVSPLSFKLARLFSSSIRNEAKTKRGVNEGLDFMWTGDYGDEIGFAVESGNRIYIFATRGFEGSDENFKKEFDRIASSLRIE